MSVAKSNGARKPGLHGPRPAHHFPKLSLGRFYAGKPRPPLPDAVDVSFGITEWGMLANDRLPNCGSAAIAHARMVKACVSHGGVGHDPQARGTDPRGRRARQRSLRCEGRPRDRELRSRGRRRRGEVLGVRQEHTGVTLVFSPIKRPQWLPRDRTSIS